MAASSSSSFSHSQGDHQKSDPVPSHALEAPGNGRNNSYGSMAAQHPPPTLRSQPRAMAAPVPTFTNIKSFLVLIRRIVEKVSRIRNLYPNDPNVIWLHGSMCKEIVSAYGRAQQRLNQCFEQSNITQQSFPPLKPVLENLVAVMMEGERFVEWCECRRNKNSNRDHEIWWMQKALYSGLSTDPTDTHIHNFLLAMCALGDAIRRNGSPDKPAAGQEGSHVHHPPAEFWENENLRDPAYILIDGVVLDNARNNDLDAMEAHLSKIIESKDRFKQDLARLLLEKLKDHRALHQATCCASPGGDQPHDRFSVSSVPGLISTDSRSEECFQWLPEKLDIFPPLSLSHVVVVYKTPWSLGGSDRQFAIKSFSDSGEKYGFASEARIHLRLHHPNIVQSLLAFDNRRWGYILMELMDTNLAQYMQIRGTNNPLSLAEKIHIMLQIAKGMEYLHRKGIMHRDLKPENVLIADSQVTGAQSHDQFGAGTPRSPPQRHQEVHESIQVKIADFNFSKIINNSMIPGASSHEMGTNRVGTTIYRAPEVMKTSERLNYGKEVDVFSFGMVSLNIFAAQLETGRQAWSMIQAGQRPDLSNELRGRCPPYLQRCIEAWLHRRPEMRPTFQEICRVLRHLYAVVLRCGPEHQLPPFLTEEVDEAVWRHVQEKARREMQILERLRHDEAWKATGRFSSHSSVNEIPYAMHTMNVVELALNRYIQASIDHEKHGILHGLKDVFGFFTHSKVATPGRRV